MSTVRAVQQIMPESLWEMQQTCNALVLDVRSENEFARDHIPGSINFPILSNLERHEVGFAYKQIDPDTATSKAFAYALPKTERLLELIEKDRCLYGPRPVVVTCWRGGRRSLRVSEYLTTHSPIEEVYQLTGGTKAFRSHVQKTLLNLKSMPPFLVLSGLTGSGKSRLIEHLDRLHLPVVHIERCARHMSSVFGEIPYQEKGGVVTQRQFENNLYTELRRASQRVFEGRASMIVIEAESRRVGPLQLSDAFDSAIHSAPHVCLQPPLSFRVQLLKEDYLGRQNTSLTSILERFAYIEKRLGGLAYQNMRKKLLTGDVDSFVSDLLTNYYDKVYKEIIHKPCKILKFETMDELLKIGETEFQEWLKTSTSFLSAPVMPRA